MVRFHGNNIHAKAPHFYVTGGLPTFMVKALNRAQ
jgi:hypothetical protein